VYVRRAVFAAADLRWKNTTMRIGNLFCTKIISRALVLVCCASLVTASASGQTFVDKDDASDLRVVTYNVNFDTIFEPAFQPAFSRVVNALQPDILNLQEILQPASNVATLLDSLLPLSGGEQWHTVSRSDNVIASRFPILNSSSFALGGVVALVDLPDATYPADILVTNDHWACCFSESTRQIEAERSIEHLSSIREDAWLFSVAADTPIVTVGDLNIVGSGQPLTTLLTGEFIEDFPGIPIDPALPPDWDGTSFTNANPFHNDGNSVNWTWRNDSSPFPPGVLDYIVYSDSVLTTGNEFVLNTDTLTAGQLADTGLQSDDVILQPSIGRFDHLPVVVDFRFIDDLAGDYNGNGIVDAADFSLWKDTLGSTVDLSADGNGNGVIDESDFTIWSRNFGNSEGTSQTVPEPRVSPILWCVLAWALRRSRQSHSGEPAA